MICDDLCTLLQVFSFLSHLHPAGSTRAIAVIGCVQVEVPEPPKAPEVPKVPEGTEGNQGGKGVVDHDGSL